ncbi:hypothetical protein J6590_104624 [Homalodisca vitripennis]|nr:hypothetical protein J6590_104624 [Homalodisca vitripennis]
MCKRLDCCDPIVLKSGQIWKASHVQITDSPQIASAEVNITLVLPEFIGFINYTVIGVYMVN